MRQKKISDLRTVYRILDKVGDIAFERYPNARGYTGHMKKIAREEFGVRLTQNIRYDRWGDDIIIVDEKLYLFAQLKF